ncbi:hypothetical protein EHQ12_04460 [Leptospira gomenensis]|uniref:Uncharacterized protein n=1 Tax=Leptospira gomenensis TaxID=2484974 RepID=A0A5F1YRZ2_9LEPT|nr:hypothetical protein [Leptospira gomenensis]TGK38682.1 hypothetical protein EHQ17_00890 [Leptospira gomenensis]TGK42909.1 hypothetical protein EHQ12_04460 [Leptospira gomenensis]TGK49632.1 hypothetical protein EHQ07_04715 [Leptospira gomenensis]TGK60806.1 hypothetical protein EHQ13_10355 [Leptospira gomenensis]
MNSPIYNYFAGPEEFLSYWKKDVFSGSGMFSTPSQTEPYFTETDRDAKLEPREETILVTLRGKDEGKKFLVRFRPNFEPEKSSKTKNPPFEFEFLPDYFYYRSFAEGFSLRLQPLDRTRIHLQIDSKIGVEFSGALHRIKGWRKFFSQ